jgi:hypothetical protein
MAETTMLVSSTTRIIRRVGFAVHPSLVGQRQFRRRYPTLSSATGRFSIVLYAGFLWPKRRSQNTICLVALAEFSKAKVGEGQRQVARIVNWSEEMDEMLAQRNGRIVRVGAQN